MNFDPGFQENSFEPEPHIELMLPVLAEESIVKTIVEGSGGPSNCEMTEAGLRFIRHILSSSRSARYGFIPNFKDLEAIRLMARDFIRRCGGPSLALQKMTAITGCQNI